MTPLEYLEIIQKLPCLVSGRASEPHHLDPIGMGRNRKKQLREHYTAIPLNQEYHLGIYPESIHALGVIRFNAKHNIDVWKEAFNLLLEHFQQETYT